MKKFLIILCLAVLFLAANAAHAFSTSGCEGDCKRCHSLSNQEAGAILKKIKLSHAKILDIQLSPVKSLWEISLDDRGKKGVIYVDFSKKYLVSGHIVEISSGASRTAESIQNIPIGKTDFSKISLATPFVIGSADAPKKVAVFSDPD
ncbi:MAG: hypothetical protein A2077_06815 [Nitrospirae bacterium GWC2_46_6]|nr:MAG: hypothetical protein A2Z82_10270 [Nitrospirae bacterium GWA2_46_11]OGW22334.1 MAG: hypothetical protein A2077_06815 [Nitrospirae bacterium GWC2_46_6]OGW23165.1 MAG: hypothetical protein A2X55_09335 [Nitrospirae bacterium GWB2_47_37]HAK87715.1 hypothetical protein [Nitrospiraceae bacterium]HCL81117.1 hypothetical protein [Nitrospiraceae bacterium]